MKTEIEKLTTKKVMKTGIKKSHPKKLLKLTTDEMNLQTFLCGATDAILYKTLLTVDYKTITRLTKGTFSQCPDGTQLWNRLKIQGLEGNFWEQKFKHDFPKNVTWANKSLKNQDWLSMYEQMEIIRNDKIIFNSTPDKKHEKFVYYRKDMIIPNIGDIISYYQNFNFNYVLITKVDKTKNGKKNPMYIGRVLSQIGMTQGSFAPCSIKSRADLQLTNKIVKIAPKDRNRIVSVKIENL